MKYLIYFGIMVGCVFSLFAGIAVGGVFFGDTLVGKVVGLAIAWLMIVGLGAIGRETGVL